MLFFFVWADWLLFPPVNLGSALVATISTGEIMRGVLGVNFTGERSLRSPVNFGSALLATIFTGEFWRVSSAGLFSGVVPALAGLDCDFC